MDDDNVDEGRAELEKEAKQLGWVPKEQFRGPEGQWRDADEFVARGREILPIVNATNKKLMAQLAEAQGQISQLKGTLSQQQQTTKDLLEHQASEIKRQVTEKLKDLREQKIEAIEEGDHKLAAKLEGEIDATKDALDKAAKAPAPAPAAATPPAPQYEPWALEFGQANDDWLGKDKRKTALFQGICEDLFETTSLRAGSLLAEAKKQMDALLDKTPPQRMAKSEGGSGGWEGSGGSSRSGGDKGFNALPQEAKDACRAQTKKFVGESGKAFKTEAEWQKHYAETFFASQR